LPRDAHEQTFHPASAEYETLNTQPQGDQPQYDVIQRDQRNKAPHHNYENAAAVAVAARS